MKKWFKTVTLLGIVIALVACSHSGIKVINLACEQAENPLGIEARSPAFAWKLQSGERNVRQTAYRILVAESLEQLQKNNGNCWDSGKVLSDNSIQVFYNGNTLLPAKTYYWKVKVWDGEEAASEWSEPACWQMGLLSDSDWGDAQWIALEKPAKERIVPGLPGSGPDSLGDMKDILPVFRCDFEIAKPLKRATAFISGLGHFEMSLNGGKVGDHFLDPGWTNYDKYALYVTFDVTSYLKQGANACGIILGNGFYHTPRERYLKCLISYGSPKTIMKLLLEYEDGSTGEVVTGDFWKTAASPITFSSIYGGEDYDARLEQDGWDKAGFDDKGWKQPLCVEGPPELRSQTATPLKVMEEFGAVRTFRSKKGDWVYDLGQNFSGIIRLSVKGKEGCSLRVWPGELLNDDSLITQQASGDPFYFQYTLKGKETETWQPKFTYYGFRYLMLEGAVPEGTENPANLPEITSINGLHTRNSAGETGSFECSNDLFNKTYHLINWAIRSNMASVFTDCPHREKLGWLEEVHLMGNSIRHNYDITRLCDKILDDMKEAQLPNGLVPDIAPELVVFEGGFRDSPEWGSTYVILPWYLYLWYGDLRPMQKHYEGMKHYVDYLTSTANNHIISHGLGDWYDLGPDSPGESQLTSKGITATAIYYYDICIMQKIARLLRKTEDETYFSGLAGQVKQAYNATYFHPDTKEYDRGSQTANSMSLFMDLVEPEYRKDVFENILTDLKERNYSQTPGDIGFNYFLRVLDEEGASETIFKINNRDDVPGYGFQLAKGATALTESWAALRYVSNNHFMLGHLMEWFYSGLAGIRPLGESVAYHVVKIAPQPVGDISWAKASYNSPYGTIVSDWKKDSTHFHLSVEIPANASAMVYFPSEKLTTLTEGGKPFKGQTFTDEDLHNGVMIGSGKYAFTIER